MIDIQSRRSLSIRDRAERCVPRWSASGKVASRQGQRADSLILTFFIAAILGISCGSFQAEGQSPVAQFDSANDSLMISFRSALKNVDDFRRSSRSTVVELTPYFKEFHSSKKIEPYLAVFHSIGIPAMRYGENQRYYIFFEIGYAKLRELGFENFAREDRLVFVFTILSERSSDVSERRVTLLNDRQL